MLQGTYLPDWTRSCFFEYTCEATGPDIPAPAGLETMLCPAGELERFACVRIDFYEVDGDLLRRDHLHGC